MDTGVRIGEGQGGGWKLVPLLGVWVPEKYMADKLTVTGGKVIAGDGGRKRSKETLRRRRKLFAFIS